MRVQRRAVTRRLPNVASPSSRAFRTGAYIGQAVVSHFHATSSQPDRFPKGLSHQHRRRPLASSRRMMSRGQIQVSDAVANVIVATNAFPSFSTVRSTPDSSLHHRMSSTSASSATRTHATPSARTHNVNPDASTQRRHLTDISRSPQTPTPARPPSKSQHLPIQLVQLPPPRPVNRRFFDDATLRTHRWDDPSAVSVIAAKSGYARRLQILIAVTVWHFIKRLTWRTADQTLACR